MKKTTMIYALTVAAIGLTAGIWCCVVFIGAYNPAQLHSCISLTVLLIICRCFPLYIKEGTQIDMSFISILTIFLVEGPTTAAALYLLTTPFIVKPSFIPGQKYSHIFNTNPVKNLFNTGNLLLSIVISGYFFNLAGGGACGTSLPECILPIFVYVTASMLVNSLLMAVLMKVENGAKITMSALYGFTQFLPNIVCAAPIGYFLAYLMSLAQGPYFVMLFMLPLMLARFSFKLYLDSKAQSYKVINALSAAIEAKDEYTVGHSKRVEQYCEIIARQMHLPSRRIERLKIAALFHDIGKIGIQDDILNKPSSLSVEEFDKIKQHPLISVHILKDIDFYGDIKDIILGHHERYDGGGYPQALKGEEIPPEARIIAVADAFDAMTSDRPYRKGFALDKAIAIIKTESGRQFDPQAAAALTEAYEKGIIEPVSKQREE